jgi:hypothetical protein
MTAHESVEVTLDGAGSLLYEELEQAATALKSARFDAALDGYVAALGLALQLGPAATEKILHVTLAAGRELAKEGEADSLATLGPAMVTLVDQVRQAGVLPASPVMDAWATVAADLGALVGQIGLALTIPPRHRAAMLDTARARAALLDDATANLFALAAWLDDLQSLCST